MPTDRKGRILREIARDLKASTAPFFGEANLRSLEQRVEHLAPATPPRARIDLLAELAEEELRVGQVDQAIGHDQAAVALARDLGDSRRVTTILERTGLAWMRLGERTNCVANHNQDSCLMPLRDGAIHRDRRGSEQAIRCFEEVLAAAPDSLDAAWLLNVAHMTLGSWPDGVPERWRIPAHAFDSEYALPRMPDVAAKCGLDTFSLAGGSILDDFDGDGRLDVLVSSMDLLAPLRLFQQQPDGTFKDVAKERGLATQLGGLQLFHFDANNDGRLDVLVQRGGWLARFGEIPNSLLIQQADGTFVDRTLEAGIEISGPSQAACFADVDLDGDVDVFLGYELTKPKAPSGRLFLNRGDATFVDATESSGVADCGFVKGCAFGDYDGDRRPDLYVTTMHGSNHLFHNEGGGRFSDVTAKAGVAGPEDSFSTFWFDYDQDGDLDLYASCYSQEGRVAAQYAWYRSGALRCDTQHLHRNDGGGRFTDVTKEVGLARIAFPMGSNFGDVDNDGFPDVYLSTGAPDFGAVFPNVMYRNDGGRRFQDVTTATDTGSLQKGHGVAFGDLDGDGDQDLFVELGGALPDDAFTDALYQNPGNSNHWLTVRLNGKRSNRFGMGSRVCATIEESGAGGAATRRDVFAFVGTNSSFGGNSLQEEMGLGAATRIVKLEVSWPTTGVTQTFTDVPLDRVVRVDEDDAVLHVVAASTSHP
jgi:hypothetical protein